MGISPMLSFSCHKAATGIFHDSLCRFAYFRRDVGILLLGPEISIAATLTAISLMMWANAAASNSAKRRILLVIVSVVCATIAFTMYLAMVTIFITGTAMLYILQFGNRAQWDERKKSSWIFWWEAYSSSAHRTLHTRYSMKSQCILLA